MHTSTTQFLLEEIRNAGINDFKIIEACDYPMLSGHVTIQLGDLFVMLDSERGLYGTLVFTEGNRERKISSNWLLVYLGLMPFDLLLQRDRNIAFATGSDFFRECREELQLVVDNLALIRSRLSGSGYDVCVAECDKIHKMYWDR